MSSPAKTIGTDKSRLADALSQRWPEAVLALCVWGSFLYFCLPALKVRFAADEMMNMYRHWEPGIWKLALANLTFSNDVIRPMGALYYMPLFKIFGFDPMPFNVVRLAVLAVNIYIFFWLAARITGSRMTAALAAVVVAYHASLSNIAYVGSFIYDVLCGGFYFSALLYYMRCRDLYGRLNLTRSFVFLGLYLCALNSKEMAVSLPVVLIAYELLFHFPGTWKAAGAPKRILADATPAFAAVALTIAFMAVKLLGPHSLANDEGFQSSYTSARFFESNSRFLNQIFYAEWFTAGGVILTWAALLYAAVRNWDQRLLLLWVWVVATPLPIAFLPGRGNGCLYIVAAGWAMVAAILVEALARRIAREPIFAKVPPRVVVTCLILLALAVYWRQTNWIHGFVSRAYLADNVKTESLIRQIQTLTVRPAHGGRIVFLNDPFPAGFDDTFYVANLWWNDHTLKIQLQNKAHLSEQQLSTMDYVFDFPGGKVTQLRP